MKVETQSGVYRKRKRRKFLSKLHTLSFQAPSLRTKRKSSCTFHLRVLLREHHQAHLSVDAVHSRPSITLRLKSPKLIRRIRLSVHGRMKSKIASKKNRGARVGSLAANALHQNLPRRTRRALPTSLSLSVNTCIVVGDQTRNQVSLITHQSLFNQTKRKPRKWCQNKASSPTSSRSWSGCRRR